METSLFEYAKEAMFQESHIPNSSSNYGQYRSSGEGGNLKQSRNCLTVVEDGAIHFPGAWGSGKLPEAGSTVKAFFGVGKNHPF